MRRALAVMAAVALLTGACADAPSSRARVEPLHGTPPAAARAEPAAGRDALQRRVLAELDGFTGWLAANDARGFIGEVGWPGRTPADADKWNDLADRWYARADAAGLPVSAWATGAQWGDYDLAAYHAPGGTGPVRQAGTQAEVLEAHPGTLTYDRGIAVAGGSFGDRAPAFSNARPGVVGTDYWYPDRATLRYVASRGFDFVRIDFRWERLQPRLHGPLDRAELRRLRQVVRSARSVGLDVVLDMHNYGEYMVPGPSAPRRTTVGSAELPTSALVDVWVRLSRVFRDEPAILAYGLMNEPHDLQPRVARATTLAAWHRSAGSWRGPARHDARRGRRGRGALRVTWRDPDGAFVSNELTKLKHCARRGGLLSVWVFLPRRAAAGTWAASLQVQDVAYRFHASAHQPLVPGRWTQVRFTPPTGVLGACRALAVHVSGPPGAKPTNLWIDDLQQRGRLLPAQVWEATSQAVVARLRERGDRTEVLVSGHGWSKVQDWHEQHPNAWIIDPDGAVTYEAHHYWNAAQDSIYGWYRDELDAARAQRMAR